MDKEIINIIEMYKSKLVDMSVKRDVQENIIAEIDASNIPDIVPIVSLLASNQPIKTIIRGVYRLRIKESDRLEAIVSQLSVLGYDLDIVCFSSRRRHTRYWRDWSSDVCSSD